MVMSEFFEFIRKYGKYLGGVDYEKVLKLLEEEDYRLRLVEEHLLGRVIELEDDKKTKDLIVDGERRRLRTKLEFLKRQERELLDLIAELKMRNVTLPELKKALLKLKLVRRELRKVRKLLKYLESE